MGERLRLRVWSVLGVLAAGATVLGVACGGDDGGVDPPACEGAACDDGGASPESSTTDSPSGTDGNPGMDAGADGDADSAVSVSCGDGGTPGTLDESFGDGGMVWLRFAGSGASSASGVAIQADGKIVVGGYVYTNGSDGLALARLLPNGSLDPSFGTNGLVETKIGEVNPNVEALALTADGRIVAAGQTRSAAEAFQMTVLRHLTDGGLDPSFGDGGVVRTAFGTGSVYAAGVALQPDGRIIVGGHTESGAGNDFAVARFNADGTLDTAFGVLGKATFDVAGKRESPGTIALLQAGKIVIAGGSATPNVASRTDLSAVRVDNGGNLDPSFADAGVFVSTFGSGIQRARSAAIDSFGRLVLGGFYSPEFAIFRLSPSGSFDSSFGDGGIVTTAFGGSQVYAVFVQEDGKLLAVGESGANSDLTLARYAPNGALDASFGAAGKTVTPAPPNTHLGTSAAAIDRCHVTVVGPWADYNMPIPQQRSMGIARYHR